tara:strand:- start:638 stop:952 length:315 start_codon:yes stop_codon:yes gene_type:complete
MIDDKMMARLKEHSKQHKGGMRGKHMRNMVKFVKEGMSFTRAHNKAKKLDAEAEGGSNNKGLTEKQKKLPEALKKAIKKSNNKDKPRPKPMGMKKTKAMGKTSY